MELLTDDAFLQRLGQRLTDYRLQNNQTQAQLAKEAGISKRTLERMEAGESVQLVNFIRVLRVLKRLNTLDELLAPPMLSPIAQLENQGQQRKRASSQKTVKPQPWEWGDSE